MYISVLFLFFFFKQKTAYEMRISDWSSDVCSSDLILPYLKHGMVELLLEDVQPDDEPIWAVYPQRRHLLPKVRQVVDCLLRELGPAMNPPRREEAIRPGAWAEGSGI